LLKICNFNRTNWDSHVDNATFAMNISFNRSINTSPYVLLMGQCPQLPIDKKFNVSTKFRHKATLLADRDKHFSTYKKDIIKNRKLIKPNLKIGDQVFIYKKVLGNEFKPRWCGGFKVTRFIGPDAYLVSNGNSSTRVSKKHIKLA
ncbi:hypothetical protein PAEPH01_1590, partial [Pancytospora epiphaga]